MLATFLLGLLIYPAFRVDVRAADGVGCRGYVALERFLGFELTADS